MVATIIIAIIVILAGVLAVRTMIKDKKNGKTCGGCGGDCSHCHGH